MSSQPSPATPQIVLAERVADVLARSSDANVAAASQSETEPAPQQPSQDDITECVEKMFDATASGIRSYL